MPKIAGDVAGGLGVGLLGIIYLIEAWQLPFGDAQNPDMGFLPIVIGIITLMLCLYLIAACLWRRRKGLEKETVGQQQQDGQFDKTGQMRVVKLVAALMLYPFGLQYIGFIIPSIALTLFFLRIMQYRTLKGSFLVAAATVIISYAVFGLWLGVAFPPELWE